MLPRVPLGDLVLEGGRDEDVALDLEDLGVRDVLGPGKPWTVPCSFFQAMTRLMSRPFGLWMPPVESETATTVAPSSAISVAAIEPALPKPWIATRAPCAGPCPRWRAASTMQKTVPRAVASLRPSEPPRLIGLPVTTPGTV